MSKPKKPGPCTRPHCWHPAPDQHAVSSHSQWTCCMCGKSECRAHKKPGKDGHGPHAPEALS